MKSSKWRKLTPEEEDVIVRKGTEEPFTGEYDKNFERGTYVCKRCGAKLYRSGDKFDARCGWPSFDDEIKGAVKRVPDPDGFRTEIQCANCGAHLGHVFAGEGYTKKNIRHCVNSISMRFMPEKGKKEAGKDEKS
jgi:methionine-R-sulfoxide reductase